MQTQKRNSIRPPKVDTSERPMGKKMKPLRPPRVAPSEVPMVTQEERNHTAPKIQIETHKMATQIEDETLT